MKNRIWVVGAVVLLSLGILGAGLKYLEDDARGRSLALGKGSDRKLLDSINPFLPSPTPSPTPQLSKEYIYAGSRLLAVEDANANAAPPADLAIWRKSTGVWWVMGGPGSQQTTVEWGMNGDIPVPGDYDGDGKTDFCVFRPSNGTWYFVNSSTGVTAGITLGQSGDTPVTGDFDGDGRSDMAVFRGSGGLGTWYVLQSSTSSVITTQFGLSSDIVAPADFDGDGKADINVWRDSNYTFYTLFSTSNSVGSIVHGSSAGTPVPADYDGDGKANYALKVGNSWSIMNAAFSNVSIVTWQQAGDTAVQNDYDGDGNVDIAVWRPSNGNWYIRQSSLIGQSGELRQVAWGMNGDIPVPAYFRR